ncbi:MAG: hypothetical protein KZQ90_11315 [Candidatus Thiodiazotropha sp. (ex Codakia rugifera)]|nr:hypothetical protein [Candidatus Thiodiazotropha sp. (ex Codakia rugifera)]
MKLEKANSTELRENVTARKADELYKKGVITSKYEFTCPDDTCDSPVTCANLDKPDSQRRREPYHKLVGDLSTHSKDCKIKADIIASKRKGRRVLDELYGDEDEYIDHAVRVNLNSHSNRRPDDATDTGNRDENEEVRLTRKETGEGAGKRKIQRSQTISSLVDDYLSGENFTVQLPGSELIELCDLFIEIDGQDVGVFPDEPRIYFGRAWFNENEKGFTVRFANKLRSDEVEQMEVRPSFFIGNDAVEASPFKKFCRANIEKLKGKQPKAVYLWSDTGPRPVKGKYINFYLKAFEYMDCRS